MDLVERINSLCRERGITMNQMEKAIGLKSTVARWADHDPSIGKVRLVAQYLGVAVSDLIGEDWSGYDLGDAFDPDEKILAQETKNPAPANGDEEKRRQDYITRFDRAPAWLQDQVLALLEAAESHRAAQDEDPTE